MWYLNSKCFSITNPRFLSWEDPYAPEHGRNKGEIILSEYYVMNHIISYAKPLSVQQEN